MYFEGVVRQGTDGDAAETFQQVVEEFVESAEEIGVFSQKQI